ncbi:hypothetical protein [Shewanella psychromarinicola]|uniref:Uncharacterized protein n=1 Tax=Shewanella psychromarinicola TaxID=2487742 RepID=A0A3N4EB48_9GAMM|nr:hypothetical protein [Shewanella psychromarinicola]AZG33892.1 hypothetical protein EGC80_02425 [Shewanella psychromarinicola]RPA31470.1 hypothetical protein EGC77_13845 [Shewanella psychromarinicola]
MFIKPLGHLINKVQSYNKTATEQTKLKDQSIEPDYLVIESVTAKKQNPQTLMRVFMTVS